MDGNYILKSIKMILFKFSKIIFALERIRNETVLLFPKRASKKFSKKLILETENKDHSDSF